jgi:thiol-disulfide isomerase/thioredoxin
MQTVRRVLVSALGVLLFALSACWAVEVLAADPPAEKVAPPAPKKDEPAAKPGDAAPKKDPFLVPDGSPEDILKYIETLQDLQPERQDPQSVREFGAKLFGALLEAGNKIMAGKPNDEQLETAVQVKLQSLMMLQRLGKQDTQKQLDDMVVDLEKMKKPELARQIKAMLFEPKLMALREAKPEEQKAVVQEVLQFMGDKADQISIGLAMNAAMILESVSSDKLAGELYRDVAKRCTGSPVAEIKEIGPKLAAAANRLEMVGKKLDVAGTLIDGQPLKWADLRGKVVLVQFWATWCAPCREEFPNILDAYEGYRDQGFEVVGISLDEKKEAVDAFLQMQKLPWKILFESDEKLRGYNNPVAAKLGIFSIPSLLLVDKEGTVVSLHARGEELNAQLEKLLGPAKGQKSERSKKEEQAPVRALKIER